MIRKNIDWGQWVNLRFEDWDPVSKRLLEHGNEDQAHRIASLQALRGLLHSEAKEDEFFAHLWNSLDLIAAPELFSLLYDLLCWMRENKES